MDESTKLVGDSLGDSTDKSLSHDQKTRTSNLFDNDNTLLDDYIPAPYIFALKDWFHGEVNLPWSKLRTARFECPPFHVLLDHLVAVLWSFYSKKWMDLLQTSQLHWALKILEGVKDRDGKHTEDVLMAIDHLSNAYMDVCAEIDIEALEEKRKSSLSLIKSGSFDATEGGISNKKYKKLGATNGHAKYEKTAQKVNLESTRLELSIEHEGEVNGENKENAVKDASVKKASKESSLDFSTFERDLLQRQGPKTRLANKNKPKVKPKPVSPSIHLRDMLEKDSSDVLEQLVNPTKEETYGLEELFKANASAPNYSKRELEESILTQRKEKYDAISKIMAEIQKMEEALDELTKESNTDINRENVEI